MRGAGDHLSVGERVAFYRARRGMTQAVLAGLVGRSEDWLSKIERGERSLRRLDIAVELARALRVTVGDLFGQPILVEDESEHADDDVPAVRDALMAPRRLSRVLYGQQTAYQDLSPEAASVLVYRSWEDFQRGRLGRVITALPGLIRSAQHLEDLGAMSDAQRRGWAVSARVHHLAATTLAKVGEADLAWIAAERSMQAADQADDPLVLASAARAGTHALLAIGRYAEALDLGETAARWLCSQVQDDDPEALSLVGMLYLRTAAAAARKQDRSMWTELHSRAADMGNRLGRDANYWQTGFGPTNVTLHRLAAALDLGDISYVVANGPGVEVGHMPVERGVSYRTDLARAFALDAQDEAALSELLTAEESAPQLVRNSAEVRETVRAMYRRSPVAARSKSSPVMGLAQRCRAVQ
ncbi:MAG: helix-turn-helix domain-containing protein [Propionibacteriales bacterium]|nr:helix-turn-helix domain-containing protein [Propionibacteriales bacterium]